MKRTFSGYAFVLLLAAYSSSAQPGRFTIDQINRLVNITDLKISPDGNSALFITVRRNLEKNNFDRELVVLNLQTKQQQVVGKDLKEISAPTWMSTGDIALIATSESSRQVQLLNIKTGATQVITKSNTGIMRYAWSPDEKWLAYLAKEDKPKPTDATKFNDSFEVGDNDMFMSGAPLNTHVWLADATGNAQRITNEGSVSTGLATTTLSWSGDSKLLVFTHYPSAHSGITTYGKNILYNAVTKEMKPVTGNKDNEGTPVITPSNQQVWFTYPRDGVDANLSDWHQVELKTGAITNITAPLDREINQVMWLPEGKVLLKGLDTDGSVLWQLHQNKFTKVTLGNVVRIAEVSVSKKGNLILSGATPDNAIEIYYKPTLADEPVLLTSFNSFVKELKLGKQEMIVWNSTNGLQPNGVVTYPPDFFPEKKYPLVLYIHGGPTASSLPGFNALPQALAAKGWIVFEPNYRGSNNLGNKFQSAISADPSEGPGQDVMSGVNALKERAYVDKDQIAVTGWSYGGWMTSWLIGRYPEVWKAAVAGAAPVDFTDMYSLNDLNRMRRHAIVESPYVGDNLAWAYKNSPIWYFNQIKVPTLIMSKAADARVTVTGSYKLFGALRDNGVETQFIAYPGPDHFPADPVRALDVYTRWIGWVEKHLSDRNKIEVGK